MKLYITTRVDGKFQPVTDADALAELQSRQSAPITDADITAAAQAVNKQYVAAQVREQRYQIAAGSIAGNNPAPRQAAVWWLAAAVVALLIAAGFYAWRVM